MSKSYLDDCSWIIWLECFLIEPLHAKVVSEGVSLVVALSAPSSQNCSTLRTSMKLQISN